MKAALAVLFCLVSAASLAAPPAAPSITVAATDIRQLEFNWEPPAGVQLYELWFRAAPGAIWTQYGVRDARRAPLFRAGVPVHLIDWRQARFYVTACNSGGCTPSNEVGVQGEQLAAMGYIKPKAPTGHRFFGHHVAVSADGKTIAVLTGETIGSTQESVAVHVYRKTTSASGWRREARLLPTRIQSNTSYSYAGLPVALSRDGSVLALGSYFESRAGGVRAGAVYIYRRSGDTWSLSQTITAPARNDDWFGYVVKLDDWGQTLAVSHRNVGDRYYGIVEIYRDPEGGEVEFVHDATLPAPPGDATAPSCYAMALSGDGATLARKCDHYGEETTYIYKLPGFELDGTISGGALDGLDLSRFGDRVLIRQYWGADVYWRGAEGWRHEGALQNGGEFTRGGAAISADGKIVALGNTMEMTMGVGPVFPPYVPGDEFNPSGGVYVYERKNTRWVLRRLVKPGSENWQWAGQSVALGDNGRLLVVGAPEDSSAATGIDGDRNDDSAPSRGAVWLY